MCVSFETKEREESRSKYKIFLCLFLHALGTAYTLQRSAASMNTRQLYGERARMSVSFSSRAWYATSESIGTLDTERVRSATVNVLPCVRCNGLHAASTRQR